jgi:hypothetical protein
VHRRPASVRDQYAMVIWLLRCFGVSSSSITAFAKSSALPNAFLFFVRQIRWVEHTVDSHEFVL